MWAHMAAHEQLIRVASLLPLCGSRGNKLRLLCLAATTFMWWYSSPALENLFQSFNHNILFLPLKKNVINQKIRWKLALENSFISISQASDYMNLNTFVFILLIIFIRMQNLMNFVFILLIIFKRIQSNGFCYGTLYICHFILLIHLFPVSAPSLPLFLPANSTFICFQVTAAFPHTLKTCLLGLKTWRSH